MTAGDEETNREIWRVCLFDALISGLRAALEPTKSTKKSKGRRKERKSLIVEEEGGMDDAERLGEFIEVFRVASKRNLVLSDHFSILHAKSLPHSPKKLVFSPTLPSKTTPNCAPSIPFPCPNLPWMPFSKASHYPPQSPYQPTSHPPTSPTS